MIETTALGPGAEFDAIRRLIDRWGTKARGIGDDAAVMRLPRGDVLVASVDTAVEGVHFKREWLSPREISYRAIAAASSDLAAMAARPVGVLVALTIPDHWRDSLDQLADGIADAVGVVGTEIRGGNLSDGAELSITTTVLGAAFAPLTRSGARPGDRVYVTGALGGPATALRLLDAGESPGMFAERFAHPVPRISEALWLADRGASAAIDISDGLVADATHLAAASRVRIELDAGSIPLFASASVDVALRSGEEYELLVAAPTDLDVDEFTTRFGVQLTRIGSVSAVPAAATGGSVGVRGARTGDDHGHDHFSG